MNDCLKFERFCEKHSIFIKKFDFRSMMVVNYRWTTTTTSANSDEKIMTPNDRLIDRSTENKKSVYDNITFC